MRRALRCTSTDARLLAAMRSGVGVACARMTTGIRSAITRTLRARGRFVTRNGADGIRTHDPLVANQVLSQLSYRPRTENRAGAPARVAELLQQNNLTGRRDAEVVHQETTGKALVAPPSDLGISIENPPTAWQPRCCAR